MVKGGGSTVGFEFVDVGQELQQTVEVVLGGAAPQHGEQQHRGLALHPLQRESTRGRRAAVPQLQQWGNESAINADGLGRRRGPVLLPYSQEGLLEVQQLQLGLREVSVVTTQLKHPQHQHQGALLRQMCEDRVLLEWSANIYLGSFFFSSYPLEEFKAP